MIDRLIIICCLLLTMGCGNKMVPANATLPSKEGEPSAVRVLTYNIHHANPPSKPAVIDIAAVAEVLKQQQPDLVALQEIDVYTNRSGKSVNQAEAIAKLAGMPYYFFGKGIDYGGGQYGVAILSKYPMEEMAVNPLPTEESTGGEHRTFTTAIITLPQGKKIAFACTHLDAQKKDTNRFLQIHKIMELSEKIKYPLIIAGDFNAVPSSRIINEMDKTFTRTCITNCGFTIPQINPTKIIDYIAYRTTDKFRITAHTVIDEKYASDHLPVLAVFEIK